jgi:hypothetical protein
MPQISYSQLLEFALKCDGKTLQTVTGKEFKVGVYRDCPYFTPASTGHGRSDGKKAAEAFLARFNETGSTKTSDYQDVTRNASYFLALIEYGSTS